MSKGKKKSSSHSRSKTPNSSRNHTPNNGRNREEKRAAARNPQTAKKSNKPIWLRIVIVAALIVMVLGFVIAPLLH